MVAKKKVEVKLEAKELETGVDSMNQGTPQMQPEPNPAGVSSTQTTLSVEGKVIEKRIIDAVKLKFKELSSKPVAVNNEAAGANVDFEEIRKIALIVFKGYREELDAVIDLVREYRRAPLRLVGAVIMPTAAIFTPRMVKAADELEQARCYIGKMLGVCGTPTYGNDYKKPEDIQKAKDKSNGESDNESIIIELNEAMIQNNYTAFCNELRNYLQVVNDTIKEAYSACSPLEGYSKDTLTFFKFKMSESRLQLGWELGEIREANVKGSQD